MQRAEHLTVVHDDDSITDFADVRYALTRHGLDVLDAAGAQTHVPAHQILTTHARTRHDGSTR